MEETDLITGLYMQYVDVSHGRLITLLAAMASTSLPGAL